MEEIKGYGLVRYSKKTGRVDKTLTGIGFGMLQLYGLQETTKTKETVVFELDTGLIRSIYTGTESGFPKVQRAIESRGEYIDEHIRQALAAG